MPGFGRRGMHHGGAVFATFSARRLPLAAMLLALAGAATLAPAPLTPALAQGAAPDEGPTDAAAPAPSGPSFAQHGIPAEATAENGVVAREKAMAAGRRAAWENLAREAGTSPRSLSDSQIEGMVSSIVIERERASPTRYSGRITVNFNPSRARSALGMGGGGASASASGGGSGAPSRPAEGMIAPPVGPAAASIDAEARYASLPEWVDLRRRLSASPDVASLRVVTVAIDGARVHLGLRAPAETVAPTLAQSGITLVPAGPNRWQLALAR